MSHLMYPILNKNCAVFSLVSFAQPDSRNANDASGAVKGVPFYFLILMTWLVLTPPISTQIIF